MTERLHAVLSKRLAQCDPSLPWVFHHTYVSSKTKERKTGPYNHRKRLMASLCRKAGVKPFGFHALRHSGASIMDSLNVPIGVIQRILGHENRQTTEIYVHSIGNVEREAMALYEQAREKSRINSRIDKVKGLH
jgi:integrase